MRRERVLPPHLYDRIKASAGEHGGIGLDDFFRSEIPVCVHGHAWGTAGRMRDYLREGLRLDPRCVVGHVEPELAPYIQWFENDRALLDAGVHPRARVSFEKWCEILNVKRGKDEDYVQSGSSAELQAAR